jgi:hypothetical protein
MRFVRRDGPLSARVVFLTIEDGSDLRTTEKFEEYYGQPEENQAWVPKTPILPSEDCGLPGVFIPKLMVALLGGTAATVLYGSDCCNIKYYPIAKKKQARWPEFLTRDDDFGPAEYYARCHSSERHEAILRAHGELFTPDRLFVILGARAQWEPFLASRVFPGERLLVLDELRNGKLIGRLIGTEKGILRYCYFWMFRRPPIQEPDIVAFAERVRARARSLLAEIPPISG